MSERLFSVEEADAELDDLRARLPRIKDARHGLIRTSKKIDEAVGVDGGGVEASDWFRFQQTLKEEVEHLAERGIVLRDPETGLVDFPAERDGRRVFLCWQMGEDRVAYFHEEHGGFSGRRPL